MSRGPKETPNQSFMVKNAGKFDIFFKKFMYSSTEHVAINLSLTYKT